ncbi:MAG: hypothetical protein GF331_12990 [Chitinivibrionales bacterium]|nr:hypothetical protein [Chitinivibrionales bacterium]
MGSFGETRIVITGLGIVAPGANTVDQFWNNLTEGVNCISPISKCHVDSIPVKAAGQVDLSMKGLGIDRRLLKKCDDFSKYCLYSVGAALEDAGISTNQIEPHRIGIYVGNNYGGCGQSEEGIRTLYTEGSEFVSPYLATNWFPAAPQGHCSLHFTIKGFSKTVVADMASSTVAIANAAKVIRDGKAAYMIAGGAEAPISTWGLVFYEKSHVLSRETEVSENTYLPFDKKRSGLVLAEGAAFVVLESYESASKRNAHIYAELTGYGITNDGVGAMDNDSSGKLHARAITSARSSSRLPDYVCLNGTAVEALDTAEARGVKTAFGGDAESVTCSAPKAFIGNSYGAAGAMDVITTIKSLQTGCIVRTGNTRDLADDIGLDVVLGENREKSIEEAMVVSHGIGGHNAALSLKKV